MYRLLARPEWPPRVRSRGPERFEGVLHALVVGCYTCKLLAEAERAGDVDGVKCANVDRFHLACRSDDTLAERNDRGRGKHSLKHQAAIDHRVRPLLTGTRHSARQLDFRDDAGGE